MKKIFLKTSALFMAFIILFMSCAKDVVIADAISKAELANIQTEMQKGLQISWDVANQQEASLKKIVDALNAVSLKEHGETIISYEDFVSTFEHYKPYILEEIKQTSMFDIFLTDGKVSVVQHELLVKLDKKMSLVNDGTEALEELSKFEENVRESAKLTTEEKNQLLIFKEGVKAQYLFNASDTNKSDCADCLIAKKWKIFGWSSAFLVLGLVGCVLLLSANAILPGVGVVAFWHCVAAIGSAWAVIIIAHCPMCIGL